MKASGAGGLPLKAADVNMLRMKWTVLRSAGAGLCWLAIEVAVGQTPAPSLAGTSDDKLELISKKIDEQNHKIERLPCCGNQD